DAMILMPSATRVWCEALRQKSPDEQSRDPVLRKIVAKHREAARKNGSLRADPFDPRASYVYDLVRYGDPFRTQWRRVQASVLPTVPYDDYREDPKFLADMAGLRKSGVPILFVHFALGNAISEGREFNLDKPSRHLMDSLRSLSGAEIYKT